MVSASTSPAIRRRCQATLRCAPTRACRLIGAAGDPRICHRLAALTQTALHQSPRLSPGVALAPHVARRLLDPRRPYHGVPGDRSPARLPGHPMPRVPGTSEEAG
ncbi:MAG: hypothetical protein LC647_10535 [Beggiatoa sp.]|nr:hypothetical protein [Beggiatoa sp.]